ncbi:MAG: hypothetical protein ACQEXG_03230 [Pseudomonadota bacterium]
MKSKHPDGRKERLRDERIYRGKWTDPPHLSRYKLGSGYEFGAGKTVRVVQVEP